MKDNSRSRWVRRFLLLFLIAFPATPSFGAAVAGYTKYFVPGSEETMLRIFNQFGAAGGTTMHAIITVTAWTGNTTLYYDHWEDGYDFDPNNPVATADEIVPMVARGAYHVFESSAIPAAPRDPAQVFYDGMDFIYAVGGTTTMTRASWIETRGTVQSVAWEVYPVEPQLTTYIMPFGEDLSGPPKNLTDFSRVFALVQATQDGTRVTVDLNNDGTPDQLDLNRDGDCGDPVDLDYVDLDQGEVFLLDDAAGAGGYQGSLCPTDSLNAGTVIKGSQTLQVQYVIGSAVYGLYETRGFSAYPRGFWSDEYYAPVDGAPGGYDTDIYLHNPHAAAITIDYEMTTGTGSFTIAAGDTVSFQAATGGFVPAGTAIYLKGTDVFWGVSSVDAESNVYEWGYPLVPSYLLDNEHFMGWSPSSYPITPGLYDSSGVFITPAQDNTTIFVDLNNDGTVDQTYNLDRLQSQYVFDNTDGDLAGAHIWGTGPYAMAFGQNSDYANTASPSIDLGYTALPGRDFIDLVLRVVKTASPVLVPTTAGSQSTYTLTVNSANFSVDDIVVIDTLPANWAYVSGTTTITLADKSQITGGAADPALSGPGNRILTWSDATLGDMAKNQEITIQFTAQTTAVFPLGTVTLNDVQASGTRTVAGVTQTFTAADSAFNSYGDISITKTSSGVDPLYPGNQFTYTVTVTNPSAAPLTGVAVYDPLPTGLSYVANSSQVTAPGRNRYYYETFPAINYTNNADNSPPLVWTNNWDEYNDDDLANNGNIRVVADSGSNRLRLGNNNRRIVRAADLSGYASAILSFDYRRQGPDNGGENVVVQVCDSFVAGQANDDACPWQTVATLAGPGTDGAYISYPAIDLTTIPAFTANSANFAIRFESSGLDNNEYVYFDNIRITVEGTGITTLPGSSEPNFVNTGAGYTLQSGQSLTLTFNVRIDNPLAVGIESITNTAWVNTNEITLPASAQVTNIVVNPSSGSAMVGNRVWLDSNGDGLQNIGEGGLANVTVVLRDQFGAPVATTVTDSNGYYLFSGVSPGTGYYIEITAGLPTGLSQSAPSGHSDNRSNAFTLVSGQAYSGANLGYKPAPGTATFGNQLWSDADSDGIRDLGEPGLGGVTVKIYLDDGDGLFNPALDTLAGTTITAADGTYLITGISATGSEDYFVAVDHTQPALSGYTPSTGTSLLNLDVNAGNTRLNNDFGFTPPPATTFTIQDRIWYDVNGDGSDAGENGIAGVTVELLDSSGTVIATATSDGNGSFTFAGVPGNNNDYTLRIADTGGVLTNYYGTTAAAIAGQYAINNLAAPASGSHFGYRITATIGDSVFNDLNGNGTQDAGELGIGGVGVRLYTDGNGNGRIDAADTLVATLTTDATGNYLFTGVANGNYIVSIGTPPTGYTFTGTDSDPVTAGHQRGVNISGGSTNLGIDFGYAAPDPRTIAGSLWDDKDGDGVVDAGESGFAGVTVALQQGGVTIATTTSTATGAYSFVGLVSGVYTVVITDTLGVLGGYLPTYEKSVGILGPFNNEETADVTSGNLNDIRFGFYKPVPTLSVVTDFTGHNEGGRMVLEWSTASELGTVGFYLQRLDPATNEFVTITPTLLPGLLHAPQGGTYRFVDQGTSPSEHTYLLIEVEASGSTRTYGPYTVTPDRAGKASKQTGADRLTSWTSTLQGTGTDTETYARRPHPTHSVAALRMSKRGPIKPPPGPIANLAATSLKFEVRERGLHFITTAEVAAATGQTERTISKLFKAGRVRLTSKGLPVPLFPGNGGAYFYAEPGQSIYTDRSVMWLTFDNRAVLRGRDIQPPQQPTLFATEGLSFLDRVHAEKDLLPITGLIRDPETDFWIWDYLVAGSGAKTFTFASPDPASNTFAQLTVHLRGATNTASAIDHRATILINGQQVGITEWAGTDAHDETFTVDPGILNNGDNTISVTGSLPTGAPYSIFYVDSFDLAYTRLYHAVDNVLFARGDQNQQVTIDGFTSPSIRVFDIIQPDKTLEMRDLLVEEGPTGFRVTFAPASPERNYLAAATTASIPVTGVHPDKRSSLKDARNSADYLVIVPAEFLETVRPLADHRASQGLRTMVVDLEDIYDEFNFGNASPHAIRDFLIHATTSWQALPKYVLLAGNGTYDYKDVLNFGDNLVPPILIGTNYGLFSSDTYLADLRNGDGVPEIAIGRIPAATTGELATAIQKIIAYEGEADGPWTKQLALVADNADEGGDFPSNSDSLLPHIPGSYTAQRIYLPDHTLAETRTLLQNSFNNGSMLVNYIGHAGLDRLASEGILLSSMVPQLINSNHLPLLTAMTCMTGRFDIPGYPTLAKQLLFSANGGVSAVWSSAGFALNRTAVQLNTRFLDNLFAATGAPDHTLGDMINASLLDQYQAMSGYNEMLDLFCLLGDPAMPVRR